MRLSSDELALPAVCGQTGKPFLMVARRKGHGVLEIIRGVLVGPERSLSGLSVPSVGYDRRAQSRTAIRAEISGATGRGAPEDPGTYFQALNMSAKIQIGSLYDGCPHCRASGYFHCSDCRMFSCWENYNERVHIDHIDVWCEDCRSWKCTSDEDDGKDLGSEVTAFAARASTVDLPSSIAAARTRPHQIDPPTSVRGYLK